MTEKEAEKLLVFLLRSPKMRFHLDLEWQDRDKVWMRVTAADKVKAGDRYSPWFFVYLYDRPCVAIRRNFGDLIYVYNDRLYSETKNKYEELLKLHREDSTTRASYQEWKEDLELIDKDYEEFPSWTK